MSSTEMLSQLRSVRSFAKNVLGSTRVFTDACARAPAQTHTLLAKKKH